MTDCSATDGSSKLREAVLTPLRQLTFWHGKNQAREFGERGAAKLVRAVMAASPARVHLMGHSFGTIVVSSAVRGPGKSPDCPAAPGRLALPRAGRRVAVGVRRGRARLDRRRARLSRGRRHPGVRVGTDRRDPLEVGLRGGQVLSARRRRRRAVPARRRPAEVRRDRHVRDPGREGRGRAASRCGRTPGRPASSPHRPSTTSTPAPSSRSWRAPRAPTTTSRTASSAGSAGTPRCRRRGGSARSRGARAASDRAATPWRRARAA